ncbi:transglutaminase family protein [Alkalihalobacillus sp. FSL R5-0424]
MQLHCETKNLKPYLCELPEVNFTHPLIREKSTELFKGAQNELEKIERSFTFVRDEIAHSWDIQSERVTCEASEVLLFKEGICYAKSNLLAALLRSQGIPTGFCYQRLMLFDTPADGYCIHALNAVYIKSLDRWIRLDARGNKEGIDAQFQIEQEKVAFQVNGTLDEVDYPIIYSKPHPKTLAVLREHTNALDMYKRFLPEAL